MATVTLRIDDATELEDGQPSELHGTSEAPWVENMTIRTLFEHLVNLGTGPFYAVRYRAIIPERNVRCGYALYMANGRTVTPTLDWRLFVNGVEENTMSGMDNIILNPGDAVLYVYTDFSAVVGLHNEAHSTTPEHLEG